MESNSAQWAALLNSLKELIHWCRMQQQEISMRKQSLQPDLNLVYKQINENKVFMCNVEYKKSIIESTLASAKLYYDDRLKSIEQSTKDSAVLNKTAASCGVVSSSPTATAAAAATQSGGFFGIRKRLSSSSSKKSKEKKNSNLAELKIKEENEETSPAVMAATTMSDPNRLGYFLPFDNI